MSKESSGISHLDSGVFPINSQHEYGKPNPTEIKIKYTGESTSQGIQESVEIGFVPNCSFNISFY